MKLPIRLDYVPEKGGTSSKTPDHHAGQSSSKTLAREALLALEGACGCLIQVLRGGGGREAERREENNFYSFPSTRSLARKFKSEIRAAKPYLFKQMITLLPIS